MTRKYVLVARTPKDYQTFARLNKLKPSTYFVGRTPQVLDKKRNLTVIFLDGWRGRKDALAMMTAVNSSEVRGVKMVEAKVDEILKL